MQNSYSSVPELSLESYITGTPSERAGFIEGLYEGLKYFGFIILKDHGVETRLLDKAYQLAAEFFALPEDEKNTYITGVGGQRGYTPFGREHAKGRDIPDLKEFWHVGREFPEGHDLNKIYSPNIWPNKPAGFEEIFLKLYSGLEEAGHIMLEALTPSLDLPEDFFRTMATDGNSILRLLHYPPIDDGAPAGAIRAAAHEDINLITILVSANGSGLELLDKDGNWLAIDTAPENLIVDSGDMLARITNDIIPATTHRVVNPQGPNASRYSMPFFMHPFPDSVLSCLESCKMDGAKYSDITAEDFLNQRLKEIGLTA